MLARSETKRRGAYTRLLWALAMTCAAWLVALSHGATALHFALISHQICADHGEVTHAERSEPHAEHRATGPAAEAGGDHASHEHCPLLGRRVEHAAVAAAPGVRLEPPAAEHSRLAVGAAGVAPSRAELLLTAPKQSPPA